MSKFDIAGLAKALKKNYSETIYVASDPNGPLGPSDHVSTGAINVDWSIGGGIPTGRITEIYSRKESQGKTELAYSMIRQAQKAGIACLFLDAEQSSSAGRLQQVGINSVDLLYGQPKTAEQTFDLISDFLTVAADKDYKALVVVDSVAALITKAQLAAAEKDGATIASLARVMSERLSALNHVITDTKAAVVLTNQVRSKIGVTYGDTLLTPGGFALKFYASLRIELRQMEKIYGAGKKVIGITVRATCKKSKVCAPFQEADFDILFSGGLDPAASYFRFALQRKLIERNGSTYSGFGLKKPISRVKFGAVMAENPKILEAINAEFAKSMKETVVLSAVDTEEEA